jgi:site-specific DNA-methyltransferase (adenine-specific)
VADDVPSIHEEEELITKTGDIWQLGRHRLMCGDSTSIDDVKTLMCGHQADMLLTDPPYNIAYEGGTKDKLTIQNDNMDSDKFRQFLRDAFAAADAVMRGGAAFYVWHSDSERCNFQGACADNGWSVRQCLIWNKSSFVLGRQDYQWKHEPCLYGWKEGAAHYFVKNRKLTTVQNDNVDLDVMTADELREYIRNLIEPTTVMDENKPTRNGEHPTMKPVALLERQIKNSSKIGEKVIDLFGGSGSTLIACERLDRTCYMMEIDQRYCDVIIKRWEELTGEKAIRTVADVGGNVA